MRMSWMRSIVITAVCAAPLALVAQTSPPGEEPPAAQPAASERRDQSPAREGESRFSDPQGGERERPSREGGDPSDVVGDSEFRPPIDLPTREEWERYQSFMKEHSPKRWGIIENLTDEVWRRRLRGMLHNRFRLLERLRHADQEMYQVNLRRIALEDEIFGISYPALRIEGRTLTSEESALLREKVAALVDLLLEEREVRVERLREMLKREEALLAAEKAQRESAIAERVSRIEQGRVLSAGGTMGGIGLSGDGGDGGFGGRGGPGGFRGGFGRSGGPRPERTPDSP